MREKRAYRTHSPSSIPCCPQIHLSLLNKTVPVAFASPGHMLSKHLYSGLKLGLMDPNTWLFEYWSLKTIT